MDIAVTAQSVLQIKQWQDSGTEQRKLMHHMKFWEQTKIQKPIWMQATNQQQK